MKKIYSSACLLVIIFMVMGCTLPMLQPELPQTPEDKSATYMSYYMAQMRDYGQRMNEAAAAPKAVTELDKTIIRAKYTFLQNAWKPIALYDSYANMGTIPPATLEREIMDIIGVLERALKEAK